MTDDHWVTKRITCTSYAVFDAIHAEAEKAVNRWNEIEGSEPPVFRISRGKDSDGFDKIWVSDNQNWRAYFGHVPSSSAITAMNITSVNGRSVSSPAKQFIAYWNTARSECAITEASGKEFTVESLVRAVLEPVLFPG